MRFMFDWGGGGGLMAVRLNSRAVLKEVIMIYEKCRDILLRECEIVQNAGVIQEKIRLAVINREWDDFQEQMNAMNAVEDKLANLEEEREQLFTVFQALTSGGALKSAADSKGRFYAMASILPEKQRNELTGIYRGLKLEALKLRIANDALMTYLSGIRSTLREFFDNAFPERGGKMYTPHGTHLSHDMRSMVLNHSF
jgi:hypothetical protein